MPTTQEVKERIERALPGAEAIVSDLTGGGDHLRAEVVYDGFAGLSRIEQHRLVYDVFGDEIGGPIHALSLKTDQPGDERRSMTNEEIREFIQKAIAEER